MDALLQVPQRRGGWPYYAGKAARIEPTAWALLALSGSRTEAGRSAAVSARDFLTGLQRADGLLLEPATPGPNYGWNGLALLALDAVDASQVTGRLASALLTVKGIQLEDDSGRVRQNSRLQAWSWTEGTFSWIEPTAYCLLALKKHRSPDPAAAARIAEAEAVIVDRVCEDGGWNYGNSQVLAQDLRPYVPTTALALLAMQDRRNDAAVARSLDWLTEHATSEGSALALALAAVCLGLYGRPIDAVMKALAAQVPTTLKLGNLHAIALAAFALSHATHENAALRIG
jgi:hypothetical protein